MPPEIAIENEPPLFAALQRADERAVAGEGAAGDVAVQLLFDDGGAYLQVVDGKGRPRGIDHRATRGALRDLLKAMALIRRRQQDLVGWESSTERIYLHHHEHLLWPLRNCAALVGEDLQPLAFVPESVGIVLDLVADRAKDPPWLTGRLLLVRDGETFAQADAFRFINETHVLAGRQIYETPPLGENFRRLGLFASSFPETMLERCLSLLFSHFTGVAVRYNGYATTVGEPLRARTSIVFQNVDESGDLHFDLIHTLPLFPVDFTRKYDIARVAVVNEAEKTIVVREVLYASLAEERLGLTRVLNRYQKELGGRADAMLYADEHGFIVGKDLAGLFLELRQMATIPEEKSEGAIVSPKREMLNESVQDAVLNGHKVLVFTNFLAAVDLLSADLEQRGIGFLTMTGATANREALVRQFQTRDDIKVFLMTLKTGGLGLNLTAADTVFIFDPWWNTAAESQAVDRTHRIGQDRTVFTYRLIVRDSVEEKIVQLQQRKRQLFDAVIASDGVALKSLTEAEVDVILG